MEADMRWIAWVTLLVLGGCLAGCMGGDAGVELRAGDALDRAADNVQVLVDEYHGEVVLGDDGREEAIAMAFVARVKSNPDNPQDVADFLAAGRKIRQDREAELARYTAALDNVKGLREVASSLRTLATQSLTLNDEARRYFASMAENMRAARAEAAATRQAERQKNREAYGAFVGAAADGLRAATAAQGGAK
jgi:hypothetical protein